MTYAILSLPIGSRIFSSCLIGSFFLSLTVALAALLTAVLFFPGFALAEVKPNQPVWSSRLTLLGGIQSRKSELTGLAGGSIGLDVQWLPVWSFGAELGVDGPREESEVLVLPPESVDLVQTRQLRLDWKPFSNLKLSFGKFPDDPAPASVSHWPFYGTALRWNADSLPVSLLARHDLYGVYSTSMHRAAGARVERDAIFVGLSHQIDMQEKEFKIEFLVGEHWFRDPDQVLPSLSIGRAEYLDAPSEERLSYRLLDLNATVTVPLVQLFVAQASVRFLHNSLATRENRAWVGTLSLQRTYQLLDFSLRYLVSSVGHFAAPPVLLKDPTRPGERAEAFETHWRVVLSPDSNAILSTRQWIGNQAILAVVVGWETTLGKEL